MTKLTAVCRGVSRAIDKQTCELTCIERQPISLAVVEEQHQAYVQMFRDMIAEGYNIALIELPALNDLPDSMFVEDVAMLYNSCAVITRPGAPSRRPEVDPIVETVKRLRPDSYRIQEPGTVDGGDVLYVANSKYVFVGKSTRSNDAAYEQMKAYLGRHGLECVQCVVRGCLHLKSAVSAVSEDTVLVNPEWVDASIFTLRGLKVIEVDPKEPDSANVLGFSAERHGKALRTIVSPAAFTGTAARIAEYAAEETRAGRPTRHLLLKVDEIAKAEGALTCCSLLSYSA
ncbi:hypothetical protein ABL78_4469 [Leptomonas seymouri]|uniref:Uncharacterized protein n=1 Tax=Leptomonas seymouri TaxID=5684 RepID=A0A0N1I6E5_LEPSE|nr:hypothetical protein ABL78_4469 [Leptomonas seymouri]|eukprot:KPI86485.1 hypothetical protein ABL78_4469 [Leptomonas seymouri]